MGVACAGSEICMGRERLPYSAGQMWPERVDVSLAEGLREQDVERWGPSASLLHSNGDAMDIAVRGGRIVGVRGRGADRVNRGRLDPKDRYGWQANHHPDRLTRPRVAGVEANWEEAMDLIVQRSRALRPDQIGFYTSGQLFLEEYYTLAVIGKAGLGTPHMDGNTRLCTATSAAALKANFGTDGQPGSYEDVDHCDALALWGHNVAETQAVLWERMLDRRHGSDPPSMIAVDPRDTAVAAEADVHLAVRPGTNLALMNALLHQIIAKGWHEPDHIAAHTVGFEKLRAVVERCSPAWAAKICDVPVTLIEQAAEILGSAPSLFSTVLQGFYQSNQATAAACQVNNLHLIRAMLGRPGAGLCQMNGQPTAQNTRETGADGDLPGFRNWANPEHVEQLARVWNVEPSRIPHAGPPTHALEIFDLAEKGEIRMLWISATNPAVSLPDLARIRRLLARPELFVVVQDIFPTETTGFADVVLPAATWGEKTGTFTNADRTVHLSAKAVDPPGEARSDLDIFLDYARRMDFRDRDGAPLIGWSDPEAAYRAWQACSAGRPCDYTAIGYAELRSGGIQWGGGRLYSDSRFNTATAFCETYGQDLVTGEYRDAEQHRELNPDGRACLPAADYAPGPEVTSPDYPMLLTTGRNIFHFHTRTKTGRVPQLNAAEPEAWVEINRADADVLGISAGDLVAITSPRGHLLLRARIGRVRPGTVFVPFHYGYWDEPEAEPHRAANELTATHLDPVSKQPAYKVTAVRIEKANRSRPTAATLPSSR